MLYMFELYFRKVSGVYINTGDVMLLTVNIRFDIYVLYYNHLTILTSHFSYDTVFSNTYKG